MFFSSFFFPETQLLIQQALLKGESEYIYGYGFLLKGEKLLQLLLSSCSSDSVFDTSVIPLEPEELDEARLVSSLSLVKKS